MFDPNSSNWVVSTDVNLFEVGKDCLVAKVHSDLANKFYLRNIKCDEPHHL